MKAGGRKGLYDKGLGREIALVVPGSDGEQGVVGTGRVSLGVPLGVGRNSWAAVIAVRIDLGIGILSYSE